jgi:hypothetical protein
MKNFSKRAAERYLVARLHAAVSELGRPPGKSANSSDPSPFVRFVQNDDRAYLGRKPSYSREQFNLVREMLGRQAIGVAQIAWDTKLTRQTIYRIKDDPAGSEAALAAWGL